MHFFFLLLASARGSVRALLATALRAYGCIDGAGCLAHQKVRLAEGVTACASFLNFRGKCGAVREGKVIDFAHGTVFCQWRCPASVCPAVMALAEETCAGCVFEGGPVTLWAFAWAGAVGQPGNVPWCLRCPAARDSCSRRQA